MCIHLTHTEQGKVLLLNTPVKANKATSFKEIPDNSYQKQIQFFVFCSNLIINNSYEQRIWS